MGVRPKPEGEFRYISMFSGGGGLDLAAGLAFSNPRCILHIEREISAAAVLATRMEEGHLPPAPIWSDCRTFDYGPWRGLVDGVVAGWPCVTVSVAGRRKGIHDKRWLWPEVWRALCETGAGWLLGENVYGLLTGNGGAAFGAVLGDLAQGGFAAEWTTLTAKAVGATHKRERVFLLAHREHGGVGPIPRFGVGLADAGQPRRRRKNTKRRTQRRDASAGHGRDVANAANDGHAIGPGLCADRAGAVSPEQGDRGGQPRGTGEPERCVGDVADTERAQRWARDEAGGCCREGIDSEGQAPGAVGGSGEALADTGCERVSGRTRMLAGGVGRTADAPEGVGGERQRVRDSVDNGGAALGDTTEQRQREPDDAARAEPRREGAWANTGGAGSGIPVGDFQEIANGSGREGSDVPVQRPHEGSGRDNSDPLRAIGNLPIHPSAPNDYALWGDVLAAYPWLAPALPALVVQSPGRAVDREGDGTGSAEGESGTAQSAVRGVADELAPFLAQLCANRIDQLRLLGNGVHVISAASAYCELYRRLMEE